MNAPSVPPPLPPGTVLSGRFYIHSVLGTGGMSTVYEATADTARRRELGAPPLPVALKLMNVAPAWWSDAVILIHREAHRLKQLEHPNIVRVYGSDWDGNAHFLVMELLTGCTLAQVHRDAGGGALGWSFIARVVEAIGAALAHAHANGVVHGDLKPGNIFICSDGAIKLLDFGTAQAISNRRSVDSEEATRHFLDRLGVVTPAYASPEMLRGEPADPRDDIFGLAVIVYGMLTGRHPFDKKTADAAEMEGLQPRRPAALDHARWRALQAALAFDRGGRTAKTMDFVRDFTEPRLWTRTLGVVDALRSS